MKKLTGAQALDLLKIAVSERGEDFRYTERFGHSCKNVVNGEPACIVGLALWRFGEQHGLPEGFMLDHKEGSIASVAQLLRYKGILDIGKKAQIVLQVAQSYQDSGDTWGEAIRAARTASYAMDNANL